MWFCITRQFHGANQDSSNRTEKYKKYPNCPFAGITTLPFAAFPLVAPLPFPRPAITPRYLMAGSPPNILFIFTDQLRADCIAALGNNQIRTPNIDRLVREGTSFSRCYTPSPVCMPARHAMTSGVAPHQSGCVDNLTIDCDRSSFIEKLNNLGYQTHGVGKMHFAKSKGDWGFQTRDHAEEIEGESSRDDYRDFLAQNDYGHVQDPYGLRSEYYYLPQPSQLPEKLHTNTWVADRSIDFLNCRDPDQPFFLWSSFIKPHPPFECPYPWSRLYRMHEMEGPFLPDDFEDQQNFWSRVQRRYKYMDSGDSKNLARMIKAAYYSTISHLDAHVGRILDALGSAIDDTLIVFSSDHGEMLGDYGCYGKRSMLDASARVPLLARLPGQFAAGAQVDRPASLIDLYPTFVETAGGKIDDSIEGISLQRLQTAPGSERCVYSQFSQNQLGLYMAANRDWKYIYSAADNQEWLYRQGCENVNLVDDPDYQAIGRALKQQAIQRFQADGYTLPLDGDDWAQFPAYDPFADADDGLLFQDALSLSKDLQSLPAGYRRDGVDTDAEAYNLLHRLVERSKLTFESVVENSIKA